MMRLVWRSRGARVPFGWVSGRSGGYGYANVGVQWEGDARRMGACCAVAARWAELSDA